MKMQYRVKTPDKDTVTTGNMRHAVKLLIAGPMGTNVLVYRAADLRAGEHYPDRAVLVWRMGTVGETTEKMKFARDSLLKSAAR